MVLRTHDRPCCRTRVLLAGFVNDDDDGGRRELALCGVADGGQVATEPGHSHRHSSKIIPLSPVLRHHILHGKLDELDYLTVILAREQATVPFHRGQGLFRVRDWWIPTLVSRL